MMKPCVGGGLEVGTGEARRQNLRGGAIYLVKNMTRSLVGLWGRRLSLGSLVQGAARCAGL
jgi:hypothetical protein